RRSSPARTAAPRAAPHGRAPPAGPPGARPSTASSPRPGPSSGARSPGRSSAPAGAADARGRLGPRARLGSGLPTPGVAVDDLSDDVRLCLGVLVPVRGRARGLLLDGEVGAPSVLVTAQGVAEGEPPHPGAGTVLDDVDDARARAAGGEAEP